MLENILDPKIIEVPNTLRTYSTYTGLEMLEHILDPNIIEFQNAFGTYSSYIDIRFYCVKLNSHSILYVINGTNLN